MVGTRNKFQVTLGQYTEIEKQLSEIKNQICMGLPENGSQSQINPWTAGSFLGHIIDPRFKLIRECKITVPSDYNHAVQLATLKPDEFTSFNNDITDKNFNKASYKLQANKEYTVKLYLINDEHNVQVADCYELLEKTNSKCVSAQGISLLWQLRNQINYLEFFPLNRWTMSLDKESSLFKDEGGNYRIPQLFNNSRGFSFSLGFFNRKRYSSKHIIGSCLVCFSES